MDKAAKTLREVRRRTREKHILPCHSPGHSSSGSGLPLCCLSASATERGGRGEEERRREEREEMCGGYREKRIRRGNEW